MSHTPPVDTEPEPESTEYAAPTRSRAPRRRTLIAAAVALLVVVVIAAAAWFMFAHKKSHYSSEQIAQAKTSVCQAYSAVRIAVVSNTHLGNPEPGNPVGQLAVASNARLALLGGGLFLHDRVTKEPATPADLANAVNSFGDTVDQLGINYLAGADNSVQDPLRQKLDAQIQQISGLCE